MMNAVLLSPVCHGDTMEMQQQSMRLVAGDGCDSPTKSVGSGRRKRSKPTRVYLDVDAETSPAEGGSGVPTSEGKIVGGAFTIEGNVIDEDSREEKGGGSMEMDVDTANSYSCDMCTDFFSSHAALMVHIENVHNISRHVASDNNGDAGTATESFPTKYHRLGSEFLQQQVAISPVAASDLAVESKPPCEIPVGENGELPRDMLWDNGSRSRIFHPDAYCEICDREFCNKYFLKTHKANKHGIYDAPSIGDGNSNGAFPITVPPYGGDIAPFPASVAVDVDRSMERPPQESHQQQPKDLAVVSCSSPHRENASLDKVAPSTAAAVKAVIQNKQLSMPCTVESIAAAAAAASNIVTTPISSTRKSSPNMEDYCDICQKHFCNKYYLKKHRHDVHGIVTDVSGSSATKRGRPLLSAMGSSPIASMATSTGFGSMAASMMPSLAPILLPPPVTMTTSSMNGTNPMPGMTTMANIMFLNPFAPPMALIQGQPQALLHATNFPPLTSLPQLLQPQSLVTTATSEQKSALLEKPGGAANNGDRLRGMVNSDTYCELCCKEFCDQYFLRIHKANKHGVYYSDMPLPASADMGLGMPLPLTKPPPTEQVKTETEEKKESMKSLASSPVLPPKPQDAQSAVSSHLSSMHKMMSVGLDLSSTSDVKFHNGSGASICAGTMFSNMVAAKFASRVMCDLCNKEVCNKYFLKTHKIKVHGVDPATLDNEKDMSGKSGSSASSAASTPSKTRDAPELIQPQQQLQQPQQQLQQPQQLQQQQQLQQLQQRPRDDELLKLGIDPEAYCEICKKEFCSKYFLKTHKANIHGIKADRSGSFGASSMMPTLDLPTHSAAMPVAVPPAVLSIPVVPPTSPAPVMQSAAEKMGWQMMPWRNPMNNSRVMCELCNKELCNKYFLKTHLLNMHGLEYDLITGLTTISTAPPSTCLSPSTPITMTTPVLVAPAPSKMLGATADDPSIVPVNMIKKEEQMEEASNGVQSDAGAVVSAKTWHVPGERPQMTDGQAKEPRNDSDSEDKVQKGYTGEFCVQKCEICGMIFGEKVTLHLHMIHDHQDQVTVRANDSPATGGGVAASVRSSLHSLVSLRRKYQRSPRRKLRGAKLKRLAVGGIGENVKSAIVNHIRNNLCQQRKKFRCVHCQERFASRLQCQTHIRAEHGVVKKSHGGTTNVHSEPSDSHPEKRQLATMTPTTNRDEAMDVTPTDAACVVGTDSAYQHDENQRRVVIGYVEKHPMEPTLQTFAMEETSMQSHFTKSVVNLPVYRKISQPITVTVTLTPTLATQ
ncbi:hypothetical protein NP493_500g01013 [Ridgeia piscesae]|uniref:C2H2-type domain-containing protein n=1 Tax=Ridgeia piscesae TaxID=27915 RepID=A0AAD9KXA7_RIDPI|nr:hypothetical protein NP493_500g01013 [Ridgeia piscesae]